MNKDFYMLATDKEQLLLLLDNGFLDDEAWIRFFTDANDAGCYAMASNMVARYSHYKIQQAVQTYSVYGEEEGV